MSMRTLDLVKSVRHTFETSRVRVLLTLLGIMIGAGSMVLLAGLLVAGEEALVRLAQNANESDMIEVRGADPPRKEAKRTTRPLTTFDARALDDSALLDGAQVNAAGRRQMLARSGSKEKPVTLFASEMDSLALYRVEVERGRAFVEEDFRARRGVCIVGQEVWTQLLEKRPLHEELRVTLEAPEGSLTMPGAVSGEVLEVVGVLAHKPTMGKGNGTWMWDRRILVPSTTYNAVFEPAHRVRGIYVRLKDVAGLQGKMRQLTDVVESTVLRRHLGVKNFEIESDARGQDQEELILRIIEILLFGTGVVALFVGGINIMNIMLVTVTERTKEIGLRRALGATPGDIARQFLLEAAALAAVGGVLGVLCGVLFTALLSVVLTEVLAPWRFVVELWSVALALGMAIATGVAFGLFPALRAARLHPVEALRAE